MIRGNQSSSIYSGYLPHSPYLKRPSPTGSPVYKRTCYDHDNYQKDSVFCCCYTCPDKNKTTSLLVTFGVCCLVLIYTLFGAVVFMALEGGFRQDSALGSTKSAQNEDSLVGVLRSQTVERLWSITENLNILYKENWTRLAAEEVLMFQESLFKVLNDYEGNLNHLGYPQAHKWSFSSSFLYSLTLITTIGYGPVSPKTSWGKLVTILYALVGIPLMLLYLSTTGDVLAKSFRRLYGKICGRNLRKLPCSCADMVRVPVTLCVVILLTYICSGAILFSRLEDWSLLEGSYFCFVSLGTIGFGDLLPGKNTEEISLCACSAYILTGLALVAMCFSLVQDEVITLFRFIGASCTRTSAASQRKNVEASEEGS
ncbi:TWiK family of potassium channels protein 7-like [Harmonia axyridis]|uniref:TWiK family of potassium channels protein 7-like n=1 Tax=Harmonia axyridis TaxID=115357 RepID=UPI001E278146|nr:TWiK family of potassium channels protein 7-like [Harmonia axyridis]